MTTTPTERKLTRLPDQELSELETTLLDSVTATAEADIAEAPFATTIRWSRDQLKVVRCAAERYGMPYQTYVKDAAFRRALEDLRALKSAP